MTAVGKKSSIVLPAGRFQVKKRANVVAMARTASSQPYFNAELFDFELFVANASFTNLSSLLLSLWLQSCAVTVLVGIFKIE